MDRRLQGRYEKLVKAHLSSSSRSAAGPAVLAGAGLAATVTQATWRFLNNDRVTLSALIEPLRDAGRTACAKSASNFVLLVHDWSKLDYGRHASKRDRRQLTHQHDIGYELTTSLLVDAASGSPLAPMQMHLKTAAAMHSTSPHAPAADAHHLDQLRGIFDEAQTWQLTRRVVHVIDREADSLGHFRDWDAAGHWFLVRSDERRVLWNGQSRLTSEIVTTLAREGKFQAGRTVDYRGQAVRQEVAETTVVLHRRHKTRHQGTRREIAGVPLAVRLIIARLVNDEGKVVACWTLLTNVLDPEIAAAQIALWYYWRWRIESFFKLLKSHGHEVEHWQQESGLAVSRRLLVAAMACVVVWQLARETTPQAEETRQLLIRLSGRRMKRGVSHTAPALLAGYFVLLAMLDLLDHAGTDLAKLKSLLGQSIPSFDTS
jgi:hypothetical protein